MKKITQLSLLFGIAVAFSSANATEYVTLGDGTSYNMQLLSQTEGSGVTVESDGVYVMSNDVKIVAGDSFTLEGGIMIKMCDDVLLTVQGEGSFNCTSNTLITRNAETDNPEGIYLNGDLVDYLYEFNNITFEYAGVRSFIEANTSVQNCNFYFNNGAGSSSGAFAISQSGGQHTVSNCVFESNTVPAIGTGANTAVGLVIDNCTFKDNNTDNSNKPQVNVSAGGDNDIVIKNSTFKGAERNKVGAISVANMLSTPGTNKVYIENNTITDHRYGITTMGQLDVRVIDNTMIDNNHETNAMNGGSGISIYDTGYTQDIYIEGNHIENSLWGITVIGGKNVNIGKTEVGPDAADYNPGRNVFVDNGNGGVLYDLYNNGVNTVYAQGNTWNVANQTADEIETVIFHKNDNEALGEVIYMDASGVEELQLAECTFNVAAKQIVGVEGNVAAYVYTLNGALAGVINAENGVIDLNNLATGVYVIKVGNQAIKVIL